MVGEDITVVVPWDVSVPSLPPGAAVTDANPWNDAPCFSAPAISSTSAPAGPPATLSLLLLKRSPQPALLLLGPAAPPPDLPCDAAGACGLPRRRTRLKTGLRAEALAQHMATLTSIMDQRFTARASREGSAARV